MYQEIDYDIQCDEQTDPNEGLTMEDIMDDNPIEEDDMYDGFYGDNDEDFYGERRDYGESDPDQC